MKLFDVPFVGPFPCGPYFKFAIAAFAGVNVYRSPTFSTLVPNLAGRVLPAQAAGLVAMLTPKEVHAAIAGMTVDMLCRGQVLFEGSMEALMAGIAGLAGAWLLAYFPFPVPQIL